MQDTRPLAGSISSNIRGIREVRLERVWELAQIVGLESDVRAMLIGLHTVIGEGGNSLSTAQLQRVYLTGALVAEPDVLVIDELVSAIPIAERQQLLSRLGQFGTMPIVVSHDIAALAGADRILRLVDGALEAVEQPATLTAGGR